jgi:hypothetical protein
MDLAIESRTYRSGRWLGLAQLINAGCWVVACLILMGLQWWNLFSLLTLPFICVIALAITSVGILIVHWIIRRRKLRSWSRAIAYALPSLLLIVSVRTFRPDTRPNHTQGLVSPSGAYRVDVPIKDKWWIVTITNRDGRVEYRDSESDFAGWLMVYWIWDEDDRLWLYSSDTGGVCFWEKTVEGWTRRDLGYWSGRYNDKDFSPPKELFPDYARVEFREFDEERTE